MLREISEDHLIARPFKEITDFSPLSLRMDVEDYLYPVRLPLNFVEIFISNVLKMAYAREIASDLFLPPSCIQVESGFRYSPKEFNLPNSTKRHVSLSWGYDDKERHIDVCSSRSLLSEKHLPDIFNTAMRRRGGIAKAECHVCYIGAFDPQNRPETNRQFLRNYASLSKIFPSSMRSRDFRYVLPFWWIEELRLSKIPERDYPLFIEHPVLKHLVSNAWIRGDRFWEKYERKLGCPILVSTL
jgi:hypothetical protein